MTPCSVVSGNATEGSALGTSRAALCNEALSCLRTSSCSILPTVMTTQDLVASCYCGGAFASCDSTNASGPCKVAFERSLETTNKQTMVNRLSDVNYGGYQAAVRVDCDQYVCPTSGCFGTQ